MMLKPVTPANEVAMEALDRDSSPRWPTNMIDIICKLYCKKLTTTRGPASFICFFSSPITSDVSIHLLGDSPPNSRPFSSFGIRGDSRKDFKYPSSICSLVVPWNLKKWRRWNIFLYEKEGIQRFQFWWDTCGNAYPISLYMAIN